MSMAIVCMVREENNSTGSEHHEKNETRAQDVSSYKTADELHSNLNLVLSLQLFFRMGNLIGTSNSRP